MPETQRRTIKDGIKARGTVDIIVGSSREQQPLLWQRISIAEDRSKELRQLTAGICIADAVRQLISDTQVDILRMGLRPQTVIEVAGERLTDLVKIQTVQTILEKGSATGLTRV